MKQMYNLLLNYNFRGGNGNKTEIRKSLRKKLSYLNRMYSTSGPLSQSRGSPVDEHCTGTSGAVAFTWLLFMSHRW